MRKLTHLLAISSFAAVVLFNPAQGWAQLQQPALSGPLYPGEASGGVTSNLPRTVVETDGERSIYNTSEPRFDLYLPDPGAASGAAVVMLPGGGLRLLGVGDGMDAEISALLDHGVAVMLVEYRTRPQTAEQIEQSSRPRPADAPPIRFPPMEIRNGNANPSPDDPELITVLDAAIADAQAALALLHERADEWGIERDRIGVMGTSAGGGVGFGTVFTHADAARKPDFLISIFGPSLQDALVPDPAPPLFLVTEADHGPVTDGLLAMFSIWKAADEKAELHVYEVPNFSMSVDLWGPRLFDWMTERGILPAPPSVTGGSGPHPAIAEPVFIASEAVLYRPEDLNARGNRSLGVLLWGNGGCAADGLSARNHLLEIASHGYVAIAPGTMDYRRGNNRQGDASGAFPPVETTPDQLIAALDWILAENRREGSRFFGRIDTQAIAVAGHSCGGLQALLVAADPRIGTAIIHNSGILNAGSKNPIRGLEFSKADLENLHSPTLYVLGGPSDIAHPNGNDDFDRIDHIPIAIAEIDVGHGGTFADENGGRAARLALDWLDWQLKGDAEAGRMFVGIECGLCRESEWSFRQKGLLEEMIDGN